MKYELFKSEDFKAAKPIGMSEVGCVQAADIANEILRNHIEALPTVLGKYEQGIWFQKQSYEPTDTDTHEARLIFIRIIK